MVMAFHMSVHTNTIHYNNKKQGNPG